MSRWREPEIPALGQKVPVKTRAMVNLGQIGKTTLEPTHPVARFDRFDRNTTPNLSKYFQGKNRFASLDIFCSSSKPSAQRRPHALVCGDPTKFAWLVRAQVNGSVCSKSAPRSVPTNADVTFTTPFELCRCRSSVCWEFSWASG